MTQDEALDWLKSLVARSFSVEPGSLSASTCAHDVPGWDSLAHSILLVRIRKGLDLALDNAAAMEAQTLGELARVVAGAGV